MYKLADTGVGPPNAARAISSPSQQSSTEKAPGPIRIVTADDHAMFRDGLRRLIETDPDLRVVGEAADGLEAVKRVRESNPDILLLDLTMPRHPGWTTLRQLASSRQQVRTIVLAATIDPNQVVEAFQLGARGMVSKEATSQLLLEAIHSVMAGYYWVGREGVSDLVRALRDTLAYLGGVTQKKNFGLTPREMEIIAGIVGAYTNKDIAQKFSLSERTIKHHLTNIFDKLGVSSRLELALFVYNHQLPIGDLASPAREDPAA